MGLNLLRDFAKKHKISYIVGLLFMFLSSYIQTLFPKILGNTIDILKLNSFSYNLIYKNIFYILLIAMGTFLSTYIWRNLVIGNARGIECYLREKLFDHFQRLTAEFYNNKKTGDLIAYAINDISAVRMAFGPAAAMSINGIVVCAISIYSMTIAINWKLTLFSLLPIPFIIFFMLRIGVLVQRRFKKVQESFGAISDRVQENINGIRVIKAYVQEDMELKAFEELNSNMCEANMSMVRISSFLSPLIELCFSISFTLNLIIGGNMVLQSSITLGDFIAFNGYLTMIMVPVISIGRVITIFQRGMASLQRLNAIFMVAPDITEPENALNVPLTGSFRIENLTFFYPKAETPALSDINIKIKPGQTLGIVGKTGSGKTTLATLLLKLYNSENNCIYIDDMDINSLSLHTLRNTFGYVPQDNFIFSATIKDNIKFFKNSYSDEDVFRAAKNSCIYNSIMQFQDKFDTKLGERGVNLSGGQKQRLSIARALIMNPPILILDDALSAVDTITEAQILSNLRRIRQDKTTIIISHRLSAVEDADEIVVLSNGAICERGTHIELIKKGGTYYDIYKEQFGSAAS